MSSVFVVEVQERQINGLFILPVKFKQINKNFCKMPFESQDIFFPRSVREMKEYLLTFQAKFIKFKNIAIGKMSQSKVLQWSCHKLFFLLSPLSRKKRHCFPSEVNIYIFLYYVYICIFISGRSYWITRVSKATCDSYRWPSVMCFNACSFVPSYEN